MCGIYTAVTYITVILEIVRFWYIIFFYLWGLLHEYSEKMSVLACFKNPRKNTLPVI